MDWISVKERLPEFDTEVKVKVEDLSYLMMGIERSLPAGEYISKYRKKPLIKCCNDARHENFHKQLNWSNNAGYYCSHWMELPKRLNEEASSVAS